VDEGRNKWHVWHGAMCIQYCDGKTRGNSDPEDVGVDGNTILKRLFKNRA